MMNEINDTLRHESLSNGGFASLEAVAEELKALVKEVSDG